MFRITFMLAACVTLAGSFPVLAQEPNEPKLEQDLLHGAIDPFTLGAQRSAFLRAAGADSEMEEKEFNTEKEKKSADRFTRPFDTWEAMVLFDSNRNATLDWLEAVEYRLALRGVLIARHDENKSKRLEQAERDAALKELKTANLAELLRDGMQSTAPPADQEYKIPPIDPHWKDGRAKNAVEIEMEKKMLQRRARRVEESRRLMESPDQPWLSDDDETRRLAVHGLFRTADHDGDGVQTPADRELFRLRLRQSRRKDSERELVKALEKYDSNKNGKLDPDESKAIKEWWKYMGQLAPRGVDTNRDGVVDEKEKAGMLDEFINDMELFDEDGNGVLNDKENETRYRAGQFDIMFREPPSPDRVNLMYGFYRTEHWREFDSNGDEKLHENEVVTLNAAFTKESKGRAPITHYPSSSANDTSHIPNE